MARKDTQGRFAGLVLEELVERDLSLPGAIELLRVDYLPTSPRYVMRGWALRSTVNHVVDKLLGDGLLRSLATAADDSEVA